MLDLTWFGWVLVALCVFLCVFGVVYIVLGVIQISRKIKKNKEIKSKFKK